MTINRSIKVCLLCSPLLLMQAVGASAQNDYYRCDRESYSRTGLKQNAKVDEVYLPELSIIIAKDKSWLASEYGLDKIRSETEKKNNIAIFTNGFQIHGQKLETESTVELKIIHNDFKSGGGAKYKCDKPIKTDWEP